MAQEFEFIPGWFGLPVPRVWCLLPLTRLPRRQAALHGHRWPGAAGHRRQALLLHRRRAGAWPLAAVAHPDANSNC
jgi:hypothetical protein